MGSTIQRQQELEIGRSLARGTLQGRWSLEALDSPAVGWKLLENDRRNANANATRRGDPISYPPMTAHRNLAREWIEANEKEWMAMVAQALAQEPIAA